MSKTDTLRHPSSLPLQGDTYWPCCSASFFSSPSSPACWCTVLPLCWAHSDTTFEGPAGFSVALKAESNNFKQAGSCVFSNIISARIKSLASPLLELHSITDRVQKALKPVCLFYLKTSVAKIPRLTAYGTQTSWEMPPELFSIKHPKPGLSLPHEMLMEDVNKWALPASKLILWTSGTLLWLTDIFRNSLQENSL